MQLLPKFLQRKPQTDFLTVATQKLQSMVSDDFFKISLEKAIQQAAEKSIENLFGNYGHFTKLIENELKTRLNIDFDQVGFGGYNEIVLKIVRRKLEEAHLAPAEKAIESALAFILEKPPESIKLSELVESFYQHLESHYHDKEGDKPTVILEESDGLRGGNNFVRIYMDGKEDTSKYSCKYQIALDGEGKAYSMAIGDSKVEKSLFFGNFYDFEKKLFQIYANKTPVIIGDFDADDLPYYPGAY